MFWGGIKHTQRQQGVCLGRVRSHTMVLVQSPLLFPELQVEEGHAGFRFDCM